ncbi:MAG TPA: hypothetical protein PK156_20435 [Polyangium sp.]|nr:hypothetical protein [Polyangium sp.]
MTYFPDLAPYRYGFGPAVWNQNGPPSLDPRDLYSWMWAPDDGGFDLPELTIGWLEPPHEYPCGELNTSLVEKLDKLCRGTRYHVTRGFHPCGICGNASDGLGSKELRILGDGVIYAAPNKIAHYVAVHRYAPPESFIVALERCEGLAEPRRGPPRPVTMDMIPLENVDVSNLDTAIRAMLGRDNEEPIFREFSLQDCGDVVTVSTRIHLHESGESIARSWNVPKKALLNMFQATHGIASMLNATYMERVFDLIAKRRHAK